MSNFHPLEVVGRGSQTQLQVGENCHNAEQKWADEIEKTDVSLFISNRLFLVAIIIVP